MSEATEAQTVADIATAGAVPDELDPTIVYSLVLPAGASQKTLDLEKFAQAPDRYRGTTELHDADSFIRLVSEHETGLSRVYASEPSHRLVAVFNDADRESGPGWADHRAVLGLRHTPEWLHWAGKDGQLVTQGAFAEHIEDGLDEIVRPDAADMLELAQTFHANTGVAFKSSTILSSGERQLRYEETTSATAGSTGQITVPREFELAIRPFEGADLYKVVARFRHRAQGGELRLGYRLTRPHDILRAAFDDTVSKVDEAINSHVLRGTPPEGVGR